MIVWDCQRGGVYVALHRDRCAPRALPRPMCSLIMESAARGEIRDTIRNRGWTYVVRPVCGPVSRDLVRRAACKVMRDAVGEDADMYDFAHMRRSLFTR